MDSLKKIAGNNIRILRKSMGFQTQLDLATALGTNQNTVARWESGVHLPEGKHKQALCEILKISWDDLTGISESINLPAQATSPLFVRALNILATLNESQIEMVIHYINSVVLTMSMPDYYKKKEKEVIAKMEAERLLPRTNIKRKAR